MNVCQDPLHVTLRQITWTPSLIYLQRRAHTPAARSSSPTEFLSLIRQQQRVCSTPSIARPPASQYGVLPAEHIGWPEYKTRRYHHL